MNRRQLMMLPGVGTFVSGRRIGANPAGAPAANQAPSRTRTAAGAI